MWIAIAIIIISLFFMILFRKDIGNFLGRSKGFKFGGTEIQAEGQTQKPDDTKPSSTEELMKAFDNPVLKEQEELIQEDLESRGVSNDKDKIQILTRFLAASHLQYTCLEIESSIFGSQIGLLEYLNNITTSSTPKKLAKAFYESAKTKNPAFFTNYSYENYLLFLKNRHLIVEQNENLLITKLGVEFLAYLTRIGKSGARFKPG